MNKLIPAILGLALFAGTAVLAEEAKPAEKTTKAAAVESPAPAKEKKHHKKAAAKKAAAKAETKTENKTTEKK